MELSPTTIRHWLRGSAFAHSRVATPGVTRTSRRAIHRRCAVHGWTEFRPVGAARRFRCARCLVESVAERRRALKRTLVGEAGGCCSRCGYDRYAGALQFHHRDAAEKVFSLSNRGVARSLEALREEASKCVLLCANCHAEVEAGVLSPRRPYYGGECPPGSSSRSGVAQWQSIRLLTEGLWVRVPPPEPRKGRRFFGAAATCRGRRKASAQTEPGSSGGDRIRHPRALTRSRRRRAGRGVLTVGGADVRRRVGSARARPPRSRGGAGRGWALPDPVPSGAAATLQTPSAGAAGIKPSKAIRIHDPARAGEAGSERLQRAEALLSRHFSTETAAPQRASPSGSEGDQAPPIPARRPEEKQQLPGRQPVYSGAAPVPDKDTDQPCTHVSGFRPFCSPSSRSSRPAAVEPATAPRTAVQRRAPMGFSCRSWPTPSPSPASTS